MSDTEPSDFISEEQRRALAAIHDGRPDPGEAFVADTGDGRRARVEPTKSTKRAFGRD